MAGKRKVERNQSMDEASAELNIALRTLKRYFSEGCPYTQGRGGKPNRCNATEIAAWMRAEGKTGTPGRPRSEASSTQQEADLRKTNAMADNWEIRNARELRELLPAAEVARKWSSVASMVRSRVLAVPTTAAAAVEGMNVEERTAEFTRMLREALEQLDPDNEPTAGDAA